MAEDLGERTEQPTGRRLSEARERGQVAKSQDLTAATDLITAVILIAAGGGLATAVFAGMMRRVLEGQAAGGWLDATSIRATVVWVALQGAKVAVPALLAMALVAIVGQIVQVGWHVSTEPLAPKLNRLNPFTGVGRVFSRRNLTKTGVNSVKLVLVGLVASALIYRMLPAIAALPALELVPGMFKTVKMGLELAIWLLAILLLLGFVDFFYQRWQHSKDLRMTRQEVKEERRSMEGDPEMKARRFRMARELAMHRIQQSVPRADVVVTNPTHFAVALQYDQANMHAPRVVAKGADMLALRVRQVAAAHGVPIVERPPLARGLFWGVEVGREIDPEFYEAVAEVLAYVYRLKPKEKVA
jgi:flagellar biosynthetic protein FlhB